jgi:hypothetical protein
MGYKEFSINAGRRSRKLNSRAIQDALTAAEANDLGILGQEHLA